jgi:hypothetical protein
MIGTPARRDQDHRSPGCSSGCSSPSAQRRPGGQLWNVGPAHGPRRTALDDLPTPTDQMLPEAPSACPLRARSAGQRWELTALEDSPIHRLTCGLAGWPAAHTDFLSRRSRLTLPRTRSAPPAPPDAAGRRPQETSTRYPAANPTVLNARYRATSSPRPRRND